PEIAGMLIGRGANVNATDGYGNTVIARAVYDSRGRGEIIETLLAHGADPDIRNERGISAIELAHTIANYDVKQFFPGGGA
ncbi:MAG: ankyrin repeat domain-containing protein, partial [Myxococcota bacterium]